MLIDQISHISIRFLQFIFSQSNFQGIEALESYIDPSTSKPEVDSPAEPEIPTLTTTVEAGTPQTIAPTAQPPSPPPKPVICKKGKCAPYDPTKDKVINCH